MLEHYLDAVRQERLYWMHFQSIFLERKGWEAMDWGFLDSIEDQRWGGSDGKPKAPRKSQRELLADLRAKGRQSTN